MWPKRGALADEKLGDEIGAEQKEEIDAEGSGGCRGRPGAMRAWAQCPCWCRRRGRAAASGGERPGKRRRSGGRRVRDDRSVAVSERIGFEDTGRFRINGRCRYGSRWEGARFQGFRVSRFQGYEQKQRQRRLPHIRQPRADVSHLASLVAEEPLWSHARDLGIAGIPRCAWNDTNEDGGCLRIPHLLHLRLLHRQVSIWALLGGAAGAPPFSSSAAWAAARRAVRTRKGEQET